MLQIEDLNRTRFGIHESRFLDNKVPHAIISSQQMIAS